MNQKFMMTGGNNQHETDIFGLLPVCSVAVSPTSSRWAIALPTHLNECPRSCCLCLWIRLARRDAKEDHKNIVGCDSMYSRVSIPRVVMRRGDGRSGTSSRLQAANVLPPSTNPTGPTPYTNFRI